MHRLSLGNSKALQKIVLDILNDEFIHSSSIFYRNGNPIPFIFLKKRTLAELNVFLRYLQRDSPAYDLRVDLSKWEAVGKMSGVFNIEGVSSILEASDYDRVDLVSSFLGKIVDRCCGME